MNNSSFSLSRRAVLGVAGAGVAAAVLGPGAAPALAAASPDVELVDNGTTVTLSNGLVLVTLTKSTGATTVLRLVGSRNGNEAVNFLGGTRGNGYTTFNYNIGSTAYTAAMSSATYAIVSQSTDRVEIVMTTADPAKLPFVAELHVAVERGTPGVYYYMVVRYPEGMPDGLTIAQLRYAFAATEPSFTYFVVDDERGVQQRPTIADLAQAVTLQDTTYALPDGSIYSKYQNISNLEGDNHVFMISNGVVGLSLIQASKEYFCGGPTKQELTCHDYYDGEILLWHPHTSHYGSPALAPDTGWEKIFGPFLLHAGEAAADDPAAAVGAMWQDAKHAAHREIALWPYEWVDEPLYAVDERSDVTGRLRICDKSTAGAWVILSPPGEDWQLQGADYLYYSRADRDGRFRLPAVRPGTYTLSAFVDGVIGEYTKTNVTVPSPDLGTLTWWPRSHGRTLWQIGTPSRSAGEFHIYGGADGFRKNLTWLEYPYEFPEGVDFTVGVDNPAEKWNYFHPCLKTPGTATQLAWRGTAADPALETWKIRFAGSRPLRGTATLDIALASSVFGSLTVALNGTQLATVDPLPGVPGDNGSYRLACRSMYRLLDPIRFAAAAILPGENVLTLTPAHAPVAPTSDNWMQPMGGVMYDVIRLQVDRP
jgi:rhamnogalacturonan endolyase